jgi:dihydroorotate dehydrogenase (NAD+) catalytic subunit
MADMLETALGRVTLKNPLIAGAAEHLIDAAGVRHALQTGVGAVVVKSINESPTGRDQLQRAEYSVLDEHWREAAWGPQAPAQATIACRSGLTPLSFDLWLEQTAKLDREAKAMDSYAVASLILADLKHAVSMARKIEEAGIRILEFNIGTPYASQAQGVVATELDPSRVRATVTAVRGAVSIPLWVKITGQSERVPELAAAAFESGADAVVMAGRLLGFIPDVNTLAPMLGTTLGVGGGWNLPLTCHWLALSRAKLGPERPLIATNGAQTGLDIARMMLAGAFAVEMASAVMLRGFGVLTAAIAEFRDYLSNKELTARHLIGRAADQRQSFAAMPTRRDHWRNYIPG